MYKILNSFLLLIILSTTSYSNQFDFGNSEKLGQSIPFIANEGQFDNIYSESKNSFVYKGNNFAINFNSNQIEFALTKNLYGDNPDRKKTIISRDYDDFKIKFKNSNPQAVLKGLNPTPYKLNYYHGDIKAENVKAFQDLIIEDIYKGVDLSIQFDNNNIELTYILDKKEDINKIQYQITNELILNNGKLLFSNEIFNFQVGTPSIRLNSEVYNSKYNLQNGNIKLSSNFKKDNNNNLQTPDVQWVEILGGSQLDQIWSLNNDSNNNLVAVGRTASINNFFPNSNSGSVHQGGEDVFIIKYNKARQVQWMTFIGGSNFDEALGMELDANNNIFLCGKTNSPDFPTTSGVLQQNIQTNPSGATRFDAFITMLDADGNLNWSTYFGGSEEEVANSISVASDGFLNIGGYTKSSIAQNFQITPDAFQSDFLGGTESIDGEPDFTDAFILVLTPTGNMFFSSYLGGSGNDEITDIVTDANTLDVVVVGRTHSNNFLIRGNPWQENYNQNGDGFIVRFDGLNTLEWSTYYGGPGWDELYTVDLDAQSNIYVAGSTQSQQFISFGNTFQPNWGGGDINGFVGSFKSTGSELIWGSYFGDGSNEILKELDVSPNGNIIVTGWKDSEDGSQDVIAGFFNVSGRAPSYYNDYYYWTTGSGDDFGNSIIYTDDPSCFFLAGFTYSNDQTFEGLNSYGNGDAFLMRVCNAPTSIEEELLETDDAKVYPLPASSNFTIELKKKIAGNYNILIYDNTGNLIMEDSFSGNIYEADLSNFSDGVYHAILNNETNSYSLKLIKN